MFSSIGLMLAMVAMPVAAPSVVAPHGAATASTPQVPCPLGSTDSNLLDPPNVFTQDGVLKLTLSLSESTINRNVNLCWVYSLPVGGKLTQFSVPPTLNVRQGERLEITLVNTLTYPDFYDQKPPPMQIDEAGSNDARAGKFDPWALMCGQPQVVPTPTQDPVTGRIYGYHRSPWDEANLHFHGLNTSPKAPGDDVVNVLLCPRAVTQPAGSYTYVVDIPRDEPPGTYWYHPHAHGESLYQVFAGLTGAIVVHSLQPSIPDKLPNRIAILRDYPTLSGTLKYSLGQRPKQQQRNLPQSSGGLAQFKRNPGLDPFQAPDRCPGKKLPLNTTYLTVNGLPLPLDPNTIVKLPTAKIGLGETQYWRLANTDGQTSLDLTLYVNGKPQPLMVTSRDGVPLVVKNGKPTYQPVAMNHVFLTPAGRIEFYLTGSVAGANMVVRTGEIDTGCVGDTDHARDLFNVVVGKKQVAQRVVVPLSTDPVPQRFSDLAAQKPVRKRTFVFTEYVRPFGEPDFYLTETSNPRAIEHPYRMMGPPDTVVKDGTVEEWTLYNFTNEIHAFHIHQIHFMPAAGVTQEQGLGQLVDTVLVPHGGYDAKGRFQPRAVKLLMDFRARDIVGAFVYHCHFLEHEDNGMMARIQVVP